MCGICGLYDLNTAVGVADVRRMLPAIAHRGPDAEGVFAIDGVALGHRRLSILDLSPAGSQPMNLGSATLVYNGEVYNFRELRRELEAMGRVFRGHSDTEVILHVYAEWGLDGLSRLEGMFALALWDESRRRLMLMRDRLGIKPLFYAWQGGRLAFGSEIKSVLEGHSGLSRDIDDQALSEYLWFGNSFQDRTFYRHVRMLPPGHLLLMEDQQIRIRPWWRIESWLGVQDDSLGPREAAAEVLKALDAAVERQMVSDVPVGIFLSGGVDSSGIAASAARLAGKRLSSYAVGFDYERGVNELPKARRVAESLGLEHHEIRVGGAALEETICALVKAHDEPFADAANIPLFLLAQALGGAPKVVLQGDGGDEMFAGYRRYAVLRNEHWWRMWPRGAASLLRSVGGKMGARFARLGSAAGHPDPGMRMALLLTTETVWDSPHAVFEPGRRAVMEQTTDPFLAYHDCAVRFAAAEPVNRMLLTDITLQLPSQFLAKVDRATMAHGLEARVPLLDEKVASLAVGMPARLKVRGSQKKIVLRDALRGRLSAEVLDGPKTGFGVPYEHWLRKPLYAFASAAILDGRFVERFQLDSARIRTLLLEHKAGRRCRGFLLWKLLQMSLWSREYLQ